MGVDPKWGRFAICPKLSRFVPFVLFCPDLSSFVPVCPCSGPEQGQKRTNGGTFLQFSWRGKNLGHSDLDRFTRTKFRTEFPVLLGKNSNCQHVEYTKTVAVSNCQSQTLTPPPAPEMCSMDSLCASLNKSGFARLGVGVQAFVCICLGIWKTTKFAGLGKLCHWKRHCCQINSKEGPNSVL